jgi:anhydro-N-acetylmuramic acid kinase
VRLLTFQSVPYDAAVRERVLACARNAATPADLCGLNALLGELFASAAEQVARKVSAKAGPLLFAASHGQTVWHQPEDDGFYPRGTLQLGEAARIARRLGVPVVSDFRQQDIAAGGQGAPLVPLLDDLLLRHARERRVALNIGGIANVTYLPRVDEPAPVIAFDTGPGNALLDEAAALVTDGKLTCDRDGALAASGRVDETLLAELLADGYFAMPPPRSTGRERFGGRMARGLAGRGMRGKDLLATLTEFTAATISASVATWLPPVDRVVASGGGMRNPELVRRLQSRLGAVPLTPIEAFGLDGDAKEAVAFAVLGLYTLMGRPANVPSATGACRPVCLGKITLP